MHKIYKYNGKAFLNINELQKKKIIEFENEINIKNFKLIENNCLCGQIGSDLQISSRDRYGIRVYNFLCSNCGLVRQNPTLDEDSLKNFYQNYYREIYEGQEHHLNFERIFLSQEQSGEKIYELLQNILDKKKLSIKKFNKVLEIGCGPGGILSFFKKKGHNVTGVDYDNNYASMINKKNIKFISDDFMNESFKGEYDIIILSHVIEHFLDIGRVVNKLNKILKSGGVLYILTPGIFKYKNYRLLNISNQHERMLFLFYIQNAHLYYFTLNSLKNIFIKFKDKLKFVYGDEEIQAIYFKEQDNQFIEKKNDYNKIVNFYHLNYFRFLFFRQIRVPIKIMIKIGFKIKIILGIKKKIFK